jgi:hypothetical protein
MVIPDLHLHRGQKFFYRSFEHAEPQRLEPDLSVVKIADRRLDEKKFQMRLFTFPKRAKKLTIFAFFP